MPNFKFSDNINGCLLKRNTTLAVVALPQNKENETEPEESVKSLDQCSKSCKAQKEPSCEAFMFQENQEGGSKCSLFSGKETIVEEPGNGTVGYCLSSKFYQKKQINLIEILLKNNTLICTF